MTELIVRISRSCIAMRAPSIRSRRTRTRVSRVDDLIAKKIQEEVALQIGDLLREKSVILFVENLYMKTGDTYQGNVGFSGPRAGDHASGVSFTTVQRQLFADIDLQTLANELGTLRQTLLQEAQKSSNADHAVALGAIASAEKSARAGDAAGTLGYLKAAGQWAWDTAKDIGVSVAAKAIEGALGLP
jgi:hypothetical protein